MSSKAVTDKPENQPLPGDWRPFQEAAPSVMREDVPTLARVVGIVGLFFFGLAIIAMVMRASGVKSGWIGPGLGVLFSVLGLVMMALHAAADKEQQVRRLYGAFGFLWLVVGIVLPFLPVGGTVGSLFGPGLVAQMIALLFLLAFVRNETDAHIRDLTIRALGVVGAAQALVAFIWGNVQPEFMPGFGILLALLGLGYLWAFV